jgi:hypothetical protein
VGAAFVGAALVGAAFVGAAFAAIKSHRLLHTSPETNSNTQPARRHMFSLVKIASLKLERANRW